ncbi:hypothetical protein [Streptosporangium sp. KLBMP 9127]|nr:hypothetical protein [Streptosporangium sp. KLBMP 9127]
MVQRTAAIRATIDASSSEGIMLEMLRTALQSSKPELITQAAAEFTGVRDKLERLLDVLEQHQAALDEHWTAGDDATQVKEQLRKLKLSTVEVVQSIRATDQGRGAPSGVELDTEDAVPLGMVPAMDNYASILASSRDDVPDDTEQEVDMGEAALQGAGAGALAGAGIGVWFAGVGAAPGAIIGGVVGGIGGAVGSSLGGDGPLFNLWGETKAEEDLRKAEEHLAALTTATALANDNFPVLLRTDIPQFDDPGTPFDPGDSTWPGEIPGGTIPAGFTPPYDPALSGDLNDPNPYAPGLGDDGTWPDPPGQDGTGPDGTGPDGTGPDGTGPDGADPNHPGTSTLPTAAVPTTSGTGLPEGSTLDTSLATHNGQGLDSATNLGTSGNGQNGLGTVIGNGSTGGGGTGYGSGGGVPMTAAGAGARLPGSGMNGMMPFMPHAGGGGQGEEDRERSTWLLEDDDIFTSDQAVIPHRLDHSARDGK